MNRVLNRLLLLALLLLGACAGNSSDSINPGSLVTGGLSGQVVQPGSGAIAGALVQVQDLAGQPLASSLTSSSGQFDLQVPTGTLDLSVEVGGSPVYQTVVFVTPETDTFLGTISVNASAPDSDGDGLSDELELAGWSISVDMDGMDQLTMRAVTSNPLEADTYGDGLDDAQELAARLDPRARDTDFDLLSDFDEINFYKSNPADVDTDGDARGPNGDLQPNPSLFDGNQLRLSGTSATLADTDGGGLTDQQEILGGRLSSPCGRSAEPQPRAKR